MFLERSENGAVSCQQLGALNQTLAQQGVKAIGDLVEDRAGFQVSAGQSA
jgi:hypothetical protein